MRPTTVEERHDLAGIDAALNPKDLGVPGYEYPNLEDVWVTESWRGRGVGTALLRFAEELARKRGCRRIGLAVNPTDNPRAKGLYERIGYVGTGEAAYIDDVYDGHENWVIDMEKQVK